MAFSNQMTRTVAKLDKAPAFLRRPLRSFLFGRVIHFAGTASLDFEQVSSERVIVNIQNAKKVQNHIKGVHAVAMALLAETATGFAVAMNLPDDKLPLIKSMKVSYLKRSQGHMRAVAQLTPEQISAIRSQEKGEVTVPVQVSDQSGQEPITCEMVWAWVPKKR